MRNRKPKLYKPLWLVPIEHLEEIRRILLVVVILLTTFKELMNMFT